MKRNKLKKLIKKVIKEQDTLNITDRPARGQDRYDPGGPGKPYADPVKDMMGGNTAGSQATWVSLGNATTNYNPDSTITNYGSSECDYPIPVEGQGAAVNTDFSTTSLNRKTRVIPRAR